MTNKTKQWIRLWKQGEKFSGSYHEFIETMNEKISNLTQEEQNSIEIDVYADLDNNVRININGYRLETDEEYDIRIAKEDEITKRINEEAERRERETFERLKVKYVKVMEQYEHEEYERLKTKFGSNKQ